MSTYSDWYNNYDCSSDGFRKKQNPFFCRISYDTDTCLCFPCVGKVSTNRTFIPIGSKYVPKFGSGGKNITGFPSSGGELGIE
ncbi:hypothetical protein FACS18948_5930 [Clostridia bacterium]|nr:hypothetical protein FACS18948_5930 [Clostridia bacterium]